MTDTNTVLYYPNNIAELLNYGCYYFKLYYTSSFVFGANKNGNNTLDVTSFPKTNTYLNSLSVKNESIWNGLFKVLGGFQAGAVAAETGAFTDAATKMSNSATYYDPSTALAGDNTVHKIAHIFLPMNEFKVTRTSGVQKGGKEGVYKNIKQNIISVALKEQLARDAGGVSAGNVLNSQGQYLNSMLGHAMSTIQFEEFSCKWVLHARNLLEYRMIDSILSYFNAATLPNIDLNDQNNLFYVLPPRVELGAITKDITPSAGNTEFETLFGSSISDEATKNKLEKTKHNGKLKYLKPKMLYYITDIRMTHGQEGIQGVFLTPEGNPMQTTLEVDMIKVNLTTVKDLFRKQNNSGTGYAQSSEANKEDFNEDGTMNPYI